MWIILISILAIFTVLLLIMPIHLKINSGEDQFFKGRFGFLGIGISMNEEHIVAVVISLPFLRFRLYPLIKNPEKEKSTKRVTKKKTTSIKSKLRQIQLLIQIIWQALGKSKIKKFYLDLDTRDYMLNSYLFPAFYMISEKPHIDLNINYTGNFRLVFEMRNNLLNIILVIIRNLIKRS